jgi:hypothetical protein
MKFVTDEPGHTERSHHGLVSSSVTQLFCFYTHESRAEDPCPPARQSKEGPPAEEAYYTYYTSYMI